MKKLMIALAALCAAGSLFDATETVNGIEWTYQVSDGKTSVGGKVEVGGGLFSAIPKTTTGAITIPSTLGGYPVKSIGKDAFSGCPMRNSLCAREGERARREAEENDKFAAEREK